MEDISSIHIQSFNFLLNDGLKRIIKNIKPYEFVTPTGDIYELRVEFIEVLPPVDPGQKGKLIYPSECRRRASNYSGVLKLYVKITINGVASGVVEVNCGEIPVMVLSKICNLSKVPRSKFASHREEERELGGYFITGGKERVIRLIIQPRRNYPMGISRQAFRKKGHGYMEQAVVMRCVREDESISTIMLHWLMNGEPTLSFIVEREQFFVPISILLRALVGKTEFEIFDDIRRGSGESLSLEENCMRILMRLKEKDFNSQSRALTYLGHLFRNRLRLPASCTDENAGIFLMQEFVAIHLKEFSDKYHILCLMIRKLHAFVSGHCCEESNDNPMFQEVLLPSSLYLMVLREKIIQLLRGTDEYINARLRKSVKTTMTPSLVHQTLIARAPDIGSALNFLLCTGNLPPSVRTAISGNLSGQATGLTVPADNINFLRLAAQFRAVHRGAMFVDIRTTSVRRLLPEAWGFICPVHTPDGTPCGLLNHLADSVKAVCDIPRQSTLDELANWLLIHKLRPVELSRQLSGVVEQQNALPCLLDGRLVGWVSSAHEAELLADELRSLKVDDSKPVIPSSLEITFIPPTDVASQYAGLYLFAGGSRLLRPVHNVRSGSPVVEWIGTFEQPYMDIAVTAKELAERSPSTRSHVEISPEGIFSFVASMTPYPDYNQSPRNMYQCQMAKQTMGHSCYSPHFRADAKAYRLLTPQSPLVRTKAYVKYDMDHYPIGFNAIVAVMSYTGYDMEDAMVINKGSYERGLAGACIYKSEVIDLSQLTKTAFNRRKTGTADHFFGTLGTPPLGLDIDGFPPIGTCLKSGHSPLYAYTHTETLESRVIKYKGGEQVAYVDAISLNGSWSHATITIRMPRPPDIGDKYSSRHGQKGINSLLVPVEEMPWSVGTGMVPDLIFNPHGFPTRMTLGMMIEFLAGKSAALSGEPKDCTPFQWSEDNPPYKQYCQELSDAGFNYWGTEMMMSGCNGRQIEAHIYMGVVYYQRLRHMVADKYQVRAEGRFDPILRQPLKGRKVGGGIRLGEMERDCLLSHGMSFTLQDRLMDSNCDKVAMFACSKCGGLVHADLCPTTVSNAVPSRGLTIVRPNSIWASGVGPFDNNDFWRCRLCDQNESDPASSSAELDFSNSHLKRVYVTAAFRYLTYELACMNIRTKLTITDLT